MKRLQLVIVALFVALGVDAQPTQRIYLSGTDVEHPRTWDFYCSGGQNSGRWSTIEVPSCWELQGYGEYTYGRFYRTKGLKPSTETGRYRTTFKVPRGGHYRLVFEGSMTDTQVWIDGKQVGEVHQGGFTEFSYDVTPYIRPNRVQKLEVLVHKESSNDSVNEAERRADWWLFGGIYLNGTRLVVKGTNRHCFHPETGRALSPAMSRQDAELLKQLNMNAVRCHYPSDRHFLELCDSIGLLYFAELPGWQTRYDNTTAARMVEEMIRRDVNYPSVYIWSNGNEGGWNRSIDHLFQKLDIQKRKVVHPWSDFEQLDTHHYPAYQTGVYRLHQGQNVFMPTEFLHGRYDKGQGAALEDMWSHWCRSPLFAGGYIWAYVDEAVRRTDLPMGASEGKRFGQQGFDIKDCLLDSDGGHGPDGCMDPYRQPEASFYTIREVWSPIYIDRLHITPSFDGRVLVENRYLFTNLSDCRMEYRLKSLKGNVLQSGKVNLPALAPNERGYARFEVPEEFRKADVLELVAYDHHGVEVCNWTEPIHRADAQPIVAKGERSVKSITFDGHGMFHVEGLVGPYPVGMEVAVRSHTQRTEADGTVVNTFRYKGGIDSIVWRQTPDGLLYMDAVVLNDERGHGLYPFLTDESQWTVGLTFDYPEERVDSLRWVGRGPYRVWKNRLKGQQFGEWALAYNNTVTGNYNSPMPPIYPEFKGYRSELRWMELLPKEGASWRVYTLNEEMYLRLFTPEEPIDRTPDEMGGLQETLSRKQERTMVPFPAGDISFLLSIPPIQSYKPLEQLGPESQPYNIRIKPGDDGFRIRLVFDFTAEE